MKDLIRGIPIVGPIVRALYFRWIAPRRRFEGSEAYWQRRYEAGGTSGPGSFDRLAAFKAEVVNDFLTRHRVRSVIELGCGDGQQVRLLACPSYLGFDVSAAAVERCRELHAGDADKRFAEMTEWAGETAEAALSLDVLYHLVEDEVFEAYMERLVAVAERFLVVYSSNTDRQDRVQSPHVRHRRFTDWMERRAEWRLLERIPNRYPYRGDDRDGSRADFYLYERLAR